jgi:DTW domain-containing protein
VSEINQIEICEICEADKRYCVCEFVKPVKTKIRVLVLRHPQEPGVDIGTAPILSRIFPNALIRTGLSWPNLAKALNEQVENKRWGVLYLGSVHTENLVNDNPVCVVDKKGQLVADQRTVLKGLHGIVLLDGTWSQAKTLWWRNAWLLKLPRLVLNSPKKSLYDQIRKEPRKGCFSTLETAALTIDSLEHRNDASEAIEKPIMELIRRTKLHKVNLKIKKKDWRRRK